MHISSTPSPPARLTSIMGITFEFDPVLMERLTGRRFARSGGLPSQEGRAGASVVADASPTTTSRPTQQPSEVELLMSDNKRLLRATERFGDKLLRQETSELIKVEEYCSEILAREYRSPVKPVPCESEKQACLDCHRQFPREPWKCRSVQSAFRSCAESAA